MREYELVFIVQPELDDSAFNEVIERVKGWIAEAGGKISNVDIWGKRTLAYPINKHTEGQYVLLDISTEPSKCSELEHNLRLLEPVIRYLITIKAS